MSMTATIVALTKPYLQLVASRDRRCSRPLYRVEIVHPDDTRHLRDWSWDYAEAVRLAERLSEELGLELRRVAERIV